MTIGERFTVDELLELVRRAAPFETLTREVLEGVLGMLAGAYPSDEFAELKPRIVWDRLTDVVEGRRDARVVAVTSGGTIPDRGLFPVFLEGEAGTPGRRVGELDEEMVYELRAGMHGDVVVLGASSWRVAEISPNRVTVTPAPGVPGKLPFWKGDTVGRPVELGRAMGAFTREIEADLERGPKGRARRPSASGATTTSTTLAAENLLAYLEDEREVDRRPADGPADRRRALPRRAGRLAARRPDAVRRPGPRAVDDGARGPARGAPRASRSRRSTPTTASRSGCPRASRASTASRRCCSRIPRRSRTWSSGGWGSRACSPAGSGRTRRGPCSSRDAARAPAPRCGSSASGPRTCSPWPRGTGASRSSSRRTASASPTCSTCRRCARSSAASARREIAVHSVETPKASAFAELAAVRLHRGQYMYEGDAPLAERRAQALTLDRDLLRELLGQEELRELLDAEALADLELSLQALARRAPRARPGPGPRPAAPAGRPDDRRGRAPGRPAGGPRRRCTSRSWRRRGARSGRGSAARSAGSRWRTSPATATASGSPRRPGVPQAFLGAGRSAALDGLLARFARTHGPFLGCRARPALGPAVGRRRRRAPSPGRRGQPRSRASSGRAAPSASTAIPRSCACSAGGRSRSCGEEVEPVDPVTLARFLPAWQGVAASPSAARRAPVAAPRPAALERLAEVVDQLAGLPIPASVLERDVLPARVPGYQPRLLDELGAMGEVAWVGRGSLGRDDGRVVLLSAGPRAAAARSGCPTAWSVRRPRSTSGSARTCAGAAPRSTASCTPPPAGGRTARSSTRCGTSSGPARSRTTRSRRCGRCAGSGRRRTRGRGPDG